MIRNMIRENRGKVLLIAGIVLMWAVLGILFNTYGYEETWQLWGVPTEMPPFKDFRLIPGAAESFRNGFEPSITNPGDPNGRIFNYPAFWRLFFYTNITQDDTIWIAVLMLVLFFLGAALFPQELSIPGAFWMLLIVFSPASMLLYERGNADLIVFFICVLIILAAGYSANLTLGLILFGAVVKMFPFFGVTVLLKEPKRKFYLLLAAGIVFMVVYSILTLKSQGAAWNTTMRGDGISYGAFVLITRFHYYVQFYLPDFLSYSQWTVLFEALALVLILLAVIPAVRNSNPLLSSTGRNLAAFRMGASIYVGTFLLGNNWDYRLAFLIFVVPQLSEWFRENRNYREMTIAVMAAVILSCWHFVFLIDFQFIPFENEIDRMVVFDELINWLLLMGFSYLLVASSPDWLRQDLQRLFGKGKSQSIGEGSVSGR
jgi:hypothetical protein